MRLWLLLEDQLDMEPFRFLTLEDHVIHLVHWRGYFYFVI